MKKRLITLDTLLLFLTLSCVAMCITLAVLKPAWVIPIVLFLALVLLWLYAGLRRFREASGRFLRAADAGTAAQSSLASLTLPVLVAEEDRIVWYNDAFLNRIADGQEMCLQPLADLMPQLRLEQAVQGEGQLLTVNGRRCRVFCSKNDAMRVLYVVDETQMLDTCDEYAASRPSVMLITIDTYDELLKEMKETDRARIMNDVENALDQFIGATTGFMRHISASKYLAVVEERHMQEIVRSRFSILDTVRTFGADADNTIVTLSIGVGRGAPTLAEGEKMAAQALDMALGRGGDQAAVKSADGFSFFGGVTRSVEKRSKVRSRIVSAAIRDLIAQSYNVLVMGHKMSDLDAIGAAVGMVRFAKICQKKAAVVVNREKTLAGNLIDEMKAAGTVEFLSPEQASGHLYGDTLLIIVDTHLPYLLESEELYRHAKNVVVIDHHRKCVGHIEDCVVFYHEPYASSTAELVTELLQYVEGDKQTRLTPQEAQALLAGMTLDTRNFALHTGVRTFEAAAYLRRMGAQTQAVKKLFNSSLEDYTYKSQLVTQAEMYMGCAVVCSAELPPEMNVVIPQAANDLLTINGIQASVVAVNVGNQISVSARSMGEVNVQLIMEKLGGGGHLTMAGAQLKDMSIEEARQKILEAIAEYREEQKKEQSRHTVRA